MKIPCKLADMIFDLVKVNDPNVVVDQKDVMFGRMVMR